MFNNVARVIVIVSHNIPTLECFQNSRKFIDLQITVEFNEIIRKSSVCDYLLLKINMTVL